MTPPDASGRRRSPEPASDWSLRLSCRTVLGPTLLTIAGPPRTVRTEVEPREVAPVARRRKASRVVLNIPMPARSSVDRRVPRSSAAACEIPRAYLTGAGSGYRRGCISSALTLDS